MKRLIVRLSHWLLPPDWRDALRTMGELGAVTGGELVVVAGLYVLRILSEAFGIVMIWPILQFIERNGDVAALSAGSRLWRVLVAAFDWLHVPVNLYSLSAIVLALITVRQVVEYFALIRSARLKETASLRLRTKLFRLVLMARADYVQAFRTGHFVTLINQHCQTVGSVIRNLLSVAALYLTVASYAVVLAVMAPVATVVAALFGLVMVRLMRRYAEVARAIGKDTVAAHQDFSQFLTERYRAWRLIKLAQSEAVEGARARAWSQQLADLYVRNNVVSGKILLFVTPLAAAFVLGGLVVAYKLLALALADITLFVIAAFRLLPVLHQSLNLRQSFSQLWGSLARVKEVADEARAAREVDRGTTRFEALREAIAFDGVTFRYSGQAGPALDEVSAIIPAGKVTAITGPSGAGKSTLVDLIPRLIVADAGTVRLDGTSVEDLALESLRGGIAYVSQQPLLFDDTIANNVRYARTEATLEEVREACRQAYATEFIEPLPQGYDTRLGEAGARLSGGQRQRLMLAQAFLKRSSILILDEPTSSLDYDSERSIRRALQEIRARGEVTVIIIAHRLSTIQDADHLIVLRQGRVIEQGVPDQLLLSNTWFARLMAEQQAGGKARSIA